MNVLEKIIVVAIVIATSGCAATTRNMSARDHLVHAAKVSRELKAKAESLPPELVEQLAMESDVGPDITTEKSYPRESQVVTYIQARPWTMAYQQENFENWPPPVSAESWPAPRDAEALRALLADKDGVIRSLAIEALSSLDLPDDVPRIASLLNDDAAGAVVLGWSHTVSQTPPILQYEGDPLDPQRPWHARSVGSYAHVALRLMTGHLFDGQDPDGVTFEEWFETHNFGEDSLWYWATRLQREANAVVALPARPGEDQGPYQQRFIDACKAYQDQLHAASVAEIRRLSPDTEAKIFLCTEKNVDGPQLNGPINEYFPEGMALRIGLPQLMEIVDGKRTWPDCDEARYVFLFHVARMAPRLLAGTGDFEAYRAHIRAALKKEADGARWMPVLYSHLLPPAATSQLMDDPRTREGYLRQALTNTTDMFARAEIAGEMVRGNLQAQWPVLEQVFYSEQTKFNDGGDVREAILKTLGEEPHTAEKLKVLTRLIDDAKNDALFMQDGRMGMDMYRKYAVDAVNAFAGKEIVSSIVLQDLRTPEKSQAALAELRKAVHEVKAAN